MSRYTAVGKQVETLGYSRVDKKTYRANWSTSEVEHYLYFEMSDNISIGASFGLRNIVADHFAIESVAKYGHENFGIAYQKYGQNWKAGCSMRFGFSQFDKYSQKLWPYFDLIGYKPEDLASFTKEFVTKYVLPLVQPITDLETYFAFLVADKEPTPWLASNMPMRATQIVCVSCQLGYENSKTRELLSPYDKLIANGLHRPYTDAKAFVDEYIENVIHDWELLQGSTKSNFPIG